MHLFYIKNQNQVPINYNVLKIDFLCMHLFYITTTKIKSQLITMVLE